MVLTGLFAVQRFGTGGIGRAFGPITLVWFGVLVALGLPHVIEHPAVLRVVALSGGYTREDANARLSRNHGMIASFSRALSEGLFAQQSAADFDATLSATLDGIYQASIT